MAAQSVAKRSMPVLRGLLAVAALAGSVLLFGTLVATRPEPQRQTREPAVLTVRTVTVAPVNAPRVWEGYGAARAMRAADVSAEVGAPVIARPAHVEPGNPVRAGDVILRLDPADFEQRLASAEARAAALASQIEGLDAEEARWREQGGLIDEEVAIQRGELERVLDAQRRNAANVADVELRLTTLRRLERESASIRQQIDTIPFQRARLESERADQLAAARIARRDLERTRIVSPIDGFLQDVRFRPGETVLAGAVVARVVDLSRIEVPLLAPMSAANELGLGASVTARSDSPLSPEWQGRVARIAPEIDPASRTVTMFAEIEQDPAASPTTLLRPGQFVIGRVSSHTTEPRLVVPRRAVDGDRVWVGVPEPEAPGTLRAVSRSVRVLYHLDASYPTLDPLETQWAVVEGDLEPGDTVIVSNLDAILPGVRLRAGTGPANPPPASPDPETTP